MAIIPLISLGKYSFEIRGVHHKYEKSECGGHIRHRKETTGLSVGRNRVDTRKIPGMLRKHSFPVPQTEEGNKNICTAWKLIHQLTHTGGNKTHNSANQYKDHQNAHLKCNKTKLVIKNDVILNVTICHSDQAQMIKKETPPALRNPVSNKQC